MRKFQVHQRNHVSATINVEIEDDRLEELATDLGKDVSELTLDDLREEAIDNSFNEGIPNLCAYCVGMGMNAEFTREEDDNWEVEEGDDAVEEIPASD